MRLACARGGAKQSSGLGVRFASEHGNFNPRIDAIRGFHNNTPAWHGLTWASLQLSSAGDRLQINVLHGCHCGNKAQFVFDFDQEGRKKAVAPA